MEAHVTNEKSQELVSYSGIVRDVFTQGAFCAIRGDTSAADQIFKVIRTAVLTVLREIFTKSLQKTEKPVMMKSFNHKKVSQLLANLDENDVYVRNLKNQLNRFGGLDEDMEKVHDRIRNKVEKQVPKDVNFLFLQIMWLWYFFAIKKLQEAFQKRQSRGQQSFEKQSDFRMKCDIDECKIAIKKLAESVTTVKNVLEKKITKQSRKVRKTVSFGERKKFSS
ncbi:unnamed protein product [Angiostrongylus costaricensis]|uniref:Myosin motor domain-containing protein n=1 Tax=Angiostrongylus costaricensis TaxID=334426 RepID=A0A158PJB9_ANGCS|nr:unnamed protein product [Angiostrongylus costaricensis]